jgi:6-phosphofructokinase 1
MGRSSGYLALRAGIICGAELVLIPEINSPIEEVSTCVEEAYKRGKTHCIIVVAEGHTPPTADIARTLESMDIGFTTRVTILGHIQRGGKPSAFDRMLATRFGVKAVEFLVAGQTGVMTALDGRDIVPIPLKTVISKPPVMPTEYYQMARILAR